MDDWFTPGGAARALGYNSVSGVTNLITRGTLVPDAWAETWGRRLPLFRRSTLEAFAEGREADMPTYEVTFEIVSPVLHGTARYTVNAEDEERAIVVARRRAIRDHLPVATARSEARLMDEDETAHGTAQVGWL